MQTVHLRINDIAGKPIACRICIHNDTGTAYAPLGLPPVAPLGRNEAVGTATRIADGWSYPIPGMCEIQLPTDRPIEVIVTKGIEYRPIRERWKITPGKMAYRLILERILSTDWLAGDTRCHFLTPHAARAEADAEGLAFVHLLAVGQDVPGQDGHLYRAVPNLEAFSATSMAIPIMERAEVHVGTMNIHPTIGRLALLNTHRPVYPLGFGGADETDDWSLADWSAQARRKSGLVVWADAYRPEFGIAGEALALAVLGSIDAFEIDANERPRQLLPAWYALLNAGIRLPLVGASGKDSNKTSLGAVRTYAPGTDHASWIESIRAGRAFVTNGPLLDFTVEGKQLRTSVRSLVPLDRLEIIHNGEVIAEAIPTGETAEAMLDLTLPQMNGWLAARAYRKEGGIFAHTSPVYGEPAPKKSAVMAQLRALETWAEWIENGGRFVNEHFRVGMRETCKRAEAVLRARIV